MRVRRVRFGARDIRCRGGGFCGSVVKGESRLLIGAADVEGVDVGVGGDGGNIEKMMRHNRTHDVQSMEYLTRASRFVSHRAVSISELPQRCAFVSDWRENCRRNAGLTAGGRRRQMIVVQKEVKERLDVTETYNLNETLRPSIHHFVIISR